MRLVLDVRPALHKEVVGWAARASLPSNCLLHRGPLRQIPLLVNRIPNRECIIHRTLKGHRLLRTLDIKQVNSPVGIIRYKIIGLTGKVNSLTVRTGYIRFEILIRYQSFHFAAV